MLLQRQSLRLTAGCHRARGTRAATIPTTCPTSPPHPHLTISSLDQNPEPGPSTSALQPLRTESLVSSTSSHSRDLGSSPGQRHPLSRVSDLPLPSHNSTEMPRPSYEYKVRTPCTNPRTLQPTITISARRANHAEATPSPRQDQQPSRGGTLTSHLTTRRRPPISSNARPLKRRPAT